MSLSDRFFLRQGGKGLLDFNFIVLNVISFWFDKDPGERGQFIENQLYYRRLEFM